MTDEINEIMMCPVCGSLPVCKREVIDEVLWVRLECLQDSGISHIITTARYTNKHYALGNWNAIVDATERHAGYDKKLIR